MRFESPKCVKMRLRPGLWHCAPAQTSLEDLTALPRPFSWIFGERERSRKGKEKSEGRGGVCATGGKLLPEMDAPAYLDRLATVHSAL